MIVLDRQRALLISGVTRSSEPANSRAIRDYFAAGLTALTIDVDVVDELTQAIDPGYSLVCDLRFSNVFNLPPAERTALASWLALGRTLIIHGENRAFVTRNTAVQDFLVALGGGLVQVANSNGADAQACVHPVICSEPNRVTSVGMSLSGRITSPGLGSRVTADSIAVWDRGQLTQSPSAKAVLILEINMWTGNLGVANRAFFDNLVTFGTR